MKDSLQDDKASELFSVKDVSRKNSLTRLLSANMEDSLSKSRRGRHATVAQRTHMLLVSDDA